VTRRNVWLSSDNCHRKTITHALKIPQETYGVRVDTSRSKRGKKNILFLVPNLIDTI